MLNQKVLLTLVLVPHFFKPKLFQTNCLWNTHFFTEHFFYPAYFWTHHYFKHIIFVPRFFYLNFSGHIFLTQNFLLQPQLLYPFFKIFADNKAISAQQSSSLDCGWACKFLFCIADPPLTRTKNVAAFKDFGHTTQTNEQNHTLRQHAA